MSVTLDDIVAIVKPYNDKLIAEGRADRLERISEDMLAALLDLRRDVGKLKWGQSYPGRNHALMDRVDTVIAKATAELSR